LSVTVETTSARHKIENEFVFERRRGLHANLRCKMQQSVRKAKSIWTKVLPSQIAELGTRPKDDFPKVAHFLEEGGAFPRGEWPERRTTASKGSATLLPLNP